MDFDEFQSQAAKSAQMQMNQTDAVLELALGLTTEAGSVAGIFRRFVREKVPLQSRREEIKQELGDVLWYIAMIAKSLNLDLSAVAKHNLSRTSDRYRLVATSGDLGDLPCLDDGYPPHERFPRKIIFHFSEENGAVRPLVCTLVIGAEPNVFEDGPIVVNGREFGFRLNSSIGDRVNDNANVDDGYRYHDAIHIAFMAVLGWSPVMRALMRVKRKSNDNTDIVEDGARARDLDEALSATLAEMSLDRNGFQKEVDIDGEVRDAIRRIIRRLECGKLPIWLWARAIHQGYLVMYQLRMHKGGYVLADLDARTVTFHLTKPEI